MEPFSTSVFKVLILNDATTTESGVSADHTEESPSKGDDDGVQAGGSDGEGEGEGDSE